ncbi:MAG: hypothetical protein ACXAEU_03485 [Candidatus Hodarchaeales archaeon]|jgi:Zn-dependent protease
MVKFKGIKIAGLGFTADEIRHLLLATVLIYLVELSFILIQFRSLLFESAIVLSLLFIPLYLLHELAHKWVAQFYGYHAYFQVVQEGAILTAISIFLPVKIIAPGAMVVHEYVNMEKNAKISLAGPLTNLIIGGILFLFAGLYHGIGYYSLLIGIIAKFSIDLAFFNMIPFPPFDGSKVINWNQDLYIVFFGTCLIAWLFNPLGILTVFLGVNLVAF